MSNLLATSLGADLAAAAPERCNKAAPEEAWNRTIAWFNKYTRVSA